MSTTLIRWRSLAWVLPAMVLLLVFVYYPIVDNLRLSLFSWNAFSVRPTFVGFDNYRTAFADPIFWTALRNNWYFENLNLSIPQLLQSGQWFNASGDGRFITSLMTPPLRAIHHIIKRRTADLATGRPLMTPK